MRGRWTEEDEEGAQAFREYMMAHAGPARREVQHTAWLPLAISALGTAASLVSTASAVAGPVTTLLAIQALPGGPTVTKWVAKKGMDAVADSASSLWSSAWGGFTSTVTAENAESTASWLAKQAWSLAGTSSAPPAPAAAAAEAGPSWQKVAGDAWASARGLFAAQPGRGMPDVMAAAERFEAAGAATNVSSFMQTVHTTRNYLPVAIVGCMGLFFHQAGAGTRKMLMEMHGSGDTTGTDGWIDKVLEKTWLQHDADKEWLGMLTVRSLNILIGMCLSLGRLVRSDPANPLPVIADSAELITIWEVLSWMFSLENLRPTLMASAAFSEAMRLVTPR